MRTTLDLPEDIHRLVSGLARHTRRSMGQVVAELVRRGLESTAPAARIGDGQLPPYELDPRTGLPQVRSRRPVTLDDVQALEDER